MSQMANNDSPVQSACLFYDKGDKKAMIRNRYNRIPHAALNTEWERDTFNQDGTRINTTQVKGKGTPLSQQMATRLSEIVNNKSKINIKRTNIDNSNKPQQKHRLGMVSIKLLGEGCLNRFYARATSPWIQLWFIYIQFIRSARRTSNSSSINQNSKHII